jgi:hypothetical protein
VRWARKSKNEFEQNVVLGRTRKGLSVRAFARRETKNGVWRRKVANSKTVAPTDLKRLLDRTIFGLEDLEQRELKEGVAAMGASYPEMRGEDVYRYILHCKTKEWVADRYGVGAKAVSNAARKVKRQIEDVGRHFKVLKGCDEANAKLLEEYFGLGVIAERRRALEASAPKIEGELDGLSSSTRIKCRGLGIEKAEGLFGWLISGRLAGAKMIGPKTLEEVTGWLEDRGFPVRKWADANGAAMDERKLADEVMAKHKSVVQGAVEDVVSAATKMIIQLGLDRIIESKEVVESGTLLRGKLWVRKPEHDEEQ